MAQSSEDIKNELCSFPNCSRTRQYDEGYCSVEHMAKADELRLTPVTENNVQVAFKGLGWTMSLLSEQHAKYGSVHNQFMTTWIKPVYTPIIERIFKLELSSEVKQKFFDYAETKGNVNRRFHGTSSKCTGVMTLDSPPCCDSTCKVCNICRVGFDTSKAGDNTGFLRYGNAIYLSSISAKANDYAVGSERCIGDKRYRCMFLCLVSAGRKYHTVEGKLDLSAPPEGFDSVVADAGPHLNYDEIVLYDCRAVLPRYLIVYSIEGPEKNADTITVEA